MRQVIDEGRNAVRGLRSSRTATLDLEQAFSQIVQEIQVSDEVEFRVIVDGEARPLNPQSGTTFIESAGKLWSTRFGIPTQKRSIWKFNTLPSKCAYWYGTTNADRPSRAGVRPGGPLGSAGDAGTSREDWRRTFVFGAECPAERKWNSLSRLRLLSATCRQIDGANCSLRHLGSNPLPKQPETHLRLPHRCGRINRPKAGEFKGHDWGVQIHEIQGVSDFRRAPRAAELL